MKDANILTNFYIKNIYVKTKGGDSYSSLNKIATINIMPKTWLKTDSPDMFTEITIGFIFDNKYHCGYNKQ